VTVIATILGTLADLQNQCSETDFVVLTAEQRLSPHGVLHSVGGRTLRVSLPRGTELVDGDVLAIADQVAIAVQAAPEHLLVITPGDALTWGIVGFQLGNLHRSVRFTQTALLTPADAMIAEMLERLAVPYEQRLTPFVGKQYVFQSSSHAHSSHQKGSSHQTPHHDLPHPQAET